MTNSCSAKLTRQTLGVGVGDSITLAEFDGGSAVRRRRPELHGLGHHARLLGGGG